MERNRQKLIVLNIILQCRHYNTANLQNIRKQKIKQCTLSSIIKIFLDLTQVFKNMCCSTLNNQKNLNLVLIYNYENQLKPPKYK